MSVIKVEVKGGFTNLGTNRYSAEASSSWEPDNINTVTKVNWKAMIFVGNTRERKPIMNNLKWLQYVTEI